MSERPAAANDLAELKNRLAEIHDLRRAQEVLFWDQTVMMPPGGGPVRGAQLTTIDRIAHERFISPEIGRLLDALTAHEESLDYDSDDASLIRTTRRDWEKARPPRRTTSGRRRARRTTSRPSSPTSSAPST
jgi:Zn-dependent M32 family carboxypeptidase